MSINLSWAFNVAVPGGPRMSLVNTPEIKVDAYDLVTVTLPASATKVAVNLQPSSTAGDVVLLALESSAYDKTVTYDPGGVTHALDGPVLLVGPGAVGLLGTTPPTKLTFDNGLTKPITVQIFVGRKV